MGAAPLYVEERYGTSVVGVVYFVPKETFLNDIVSAIQIGENSRAYMINKTGDTIADITLDTITVQNIEKEAKEDPSLGELSAIHAEMRQGKTGFGSYTSGEHKMFAAYAPVKDTDGWSIAVTAPQLNYLASTRDAMIVNVAVIAVAMLASAVVALILAFRIRGPWRAEQPADEGLRAAHEAVGGRRSGDTDAQNHQQGRDGDACQIDGGACGGTEHRDQRHRLFAQRDGEPEPGCPHRA